MAPEQARGEAVSRLTDTYAAAIVFWELLTGERLFVGKTEAETIDKCLVGRVQPPSLFAPDLGTKMDAILRKALSREPSKRYQTARELALDIEACCAGSPTVGGGRLGGGDRRRCARSTRGGAGGDRARGDSTRRRAHERRRWWPTLDPGGDRSWALQRSSRHEEPPSSLLRPRAPERSSRAHPSPRRRPLRSQSRPRAHRRPMRPPSRALRRPPQPHTRCLGPSPLRDRTARSGARCNPAVLDRLRREADFKPECM